MSNQPPTRSWYRLPNISRQPPPPPPPQPPSPPRQPRVPVIRTTFRPTFSVAQLPPPPPASSTTPTQPPSPKIPPPFAVTPPSPQLPSPNTPPPSFTITSPSPPPPTQLPKPNTPPPFTIASPSPPPPTQLPKPNTPPPFTITSPSPPPPTQLPKPNTPPPFPISSPSPPPLRQSPPVASSQPYLSPLSSPSPIKTTRSPPPLSLPPTQLPSPRGEYSEAEQEKVLLQDTFNKKVVFPSNSEGNSIKAHNKSSTKLGRHKLSSDSEDGNSVRIISMTGENKGAFMELGLNADHKGAKMSPSLPMSGYVNSNVQGINNSILSGCSITHHDPGVHFSLSRKRAVGGKGDRGSHRREAANGNKV